MNVRRVRYKPGGGVELVDVEVGDPSPMQVQVAGKIDGHIKRGCNPVNR
ncbi:MAG: hypothetical protein VX792_18110 [Candidatus Latescibacterota bacterium]|nr:hypothetical protein [Candidatus Latescibacterota bacterium]